MAKEGFVCIFALWRKLLCCRRLASGKQQSTGLLHLDGSNPSFLIKRKPILLDELSFYGGEGGI